MSFLKEQDVNINMQKNNFFHTLFLFILKDCSSLENFSPYDFYEFPLYFFLLLNFHIPVITRFFFFIIILIILSLFPFFMIFVI